MLYIRYTNPPSHIVSDTVTVCPAIIDAGREPVEELAYSRLPEDDKATTPVIIRRPKRVTLSDEEATRRRPPGVIDLALCNSRSPGDVVAMTAVVRELHRNYPGRYRVVTQTWFPELWENNPGVVPESEIVQPKRIDWDWKGTAEIDRRCSFAQLWRNDLAKHLGVSIPMGEDRGAIYLSEAEKCWPSHLLGPVVRPFAIVNAGTKADTPTKAWGKSNYQSVIDHFQGKIEFVQIGAAEHNHLPLNGVLNLVGKTGVRDLCRLVYWSRLVLCPVTFVMHLSAAILLADDRVRPCIVLAGGRESQTFTQYDGHVQFNTVGMLPCCARDGCWRSQFPPSPCGEMHICQQPAQLASGETVGQCMKIIDPSRVIDAISDRFAM